MREENKKVVAAQTHSVVRKGCRWNLNSDFSTIFYCYFPSSKTSQPHRICKYQSSPLLPLKWSEVKLLRRVWLCVTPLTVAYQDPQSMGFSRQEYWSELPLPSPLTVQSKKSPITTYYTNLQKKFKCFKRVGTCCSWGKLLF